MRQLGEGFFWWWISMALRQTSEQKLDQINQRSKNEKRRIWLLDSKKKKEVRPTPLDMLRLYPCFWQNVFLQVAELLIFPARAWSPKQPSLVIEELFGINNLFSKILCIHHLGGLLSCQKRCVGSTITGSESKPRTEGSACCSKSQTAAWKNPRQPRQKSKIM